MGVVKCIMFLFSIVFVLNLVECKDSVPVFIWSTQKPNEKVPALHRVGEESFRDDIVERLRDNPFVVIFAEPTLSPEDFTQRDNMGTLVFKNLANLKSSTKTSYLPYVQNPINVFRELEASVAEISVEKLNGYSYPETDILIINLDDVKENEDRFEMLKRHDEIMYSVFEKLRQKYHNLWGVYTAKHTSWVGSEDVPHYRKTRQTFSDVATTVSSFQNTSNSFVYFTNAILYHEEVYPLELEVHTANDTSNNTLVTLVFANETNNVSFSLTFVKGQQYDLGYYQLVLPIEASINSSNYNLSTNSEIYAPINFSYHCGDQNFTQGEVGVYLKNFQVQIFFDEAPTKVQFSDAYDCIGFTSIPIWSGLFVTTILLIIMSLGITMMMEIRTMDRFDDAKGKTITINASE